MDAENPPFSTGIRCSASNSLIPVYYTGIRCSASNSRLSKIQGRTILFSKFIKLTTIMKKHLQGIFTETYKSDKNKYLWVSCPCSFLLETEEVVETRKFGSARRLVLLISLEIFNAIMTTKSRVSYIQVLGIKKIEKYFLYIS